MRFLGLTCVGIAAVGLAAGCGPGLPSGLEGFGDGDGDNETIGDGDGDDTIGDGDGDGTCVIEGDIGSETYAYFEIWLSLELGDDIPNFCSGSIADYAVTWKAPLSGTYRAVLYTDVNAGLMVLRGDCQGSLEGCGALDFPISVDFQAIAGEQYTLVIDGEAESWYGVELFPLDLMPGSCPNGVLFGTEETVFGSTETADFEFSSPCGGADSPDAAYLFIPPVSGMYWIDTFGSDFNTVLSVLEGECAWGALLECNDNALDSSQSLIMMPLLADHIYTLVVDGAGAAGSYQLNVTLMDAFPQVCDGLEFLPSQTPMLVEWPNDQSSNDAWQGCGMEPLERRFSWTPPASGSYRVTQLALATFSSALSVLNDCQAAGFTCGSGDGLVEFEFEGIAGQPVILVSEWQPVGPGFVTLTIDKLDSNIGCGESLGSEVPLMYANSTLGAGSDHSGSCSVNSAPERELHWTAPANGTYRFALEGSSYDTLLYIRNGGCDGPELGCNDDTVTQSGLELWSTLELNLTAGQTISIFVDGYNTGGDFLLTISQV